MINSWRCGVGTALLAAATLACSGFPDKPVTLVVPFAAGDPSDKIARDLADALRKPFGQTLIADNAGGTGGVIGSAKVARAWLNGYTGWCSISAWRPRRRCTARGSDE